jgi:signal transduction histidine kinase
MNLGAYIPLAGFFVNLFFAAFIFSRGIRISEHRAYLIVTVSIAIWNLGSYNLFVVKEAHEALFWARFVFMGCIFGVVAFFHLAMVIAGFSLGKWMRWLYGFQIALALTNLTPLFVRDVQYLGTSGWYSVAGPIFYVFNIPFSLMFGSIFVLLHRRRKVPKVRRARFTPMIVAQSMLSVLGANDIMPIVGITHYPLTNVQVYPWGSLASVFYGVITGYSVLHHELIDIQARLGRYGAQFIRVSIIFFTSLGLLLFAATATNAFNIQSFLASLAVFVVSAAVGVLVFPRLFATKGVERFERQLLGDHFEYQDRVRFFISRIPQYDERSTLLEDLHVILHHSFELGSYQLIARDESNRAFALVRAHPERPMQQIVGFDARSPLLRYFSDKNRRHLFQTDLGQGELDVSPEGSARAQMMEFQAELCLPIRTKDDTFGLLLVGTKATDEPFTATDLTLLQDLAEALSQFLEQLSLKSQVLLAQEMELLGRMSGGMAHDLNNLLTPISTALQLASEMPSRTIEDHIDSDLVESAMDNVRAMRAYIKEALFFSQNLRPDFQEARLDDLVQKAINHAKLSRPKRVNIRAEAMGEALAELDGVLIERLFANLIVNSIDASPEHSTVRLELERLIKTEADRDWFRVRVIDSGEGIPKENLNSILKPYFTTKIHGDQQRGSGLGLAICRKIVFLHNGHLSITSQPGKGTTVQVDLPSHQPGAKAKAVADAA